MNEQQTSVPTWFRVVAVAALLWNIIGCLILLSDVFAQETMIESMTDEQKEWARSTPAWVNIVFAIAVGAGIAGSIYLLKRKILSVPLFATSFVAVLIQMVYTMLIAGGLKVMGPSGAVMPLIVITLAIAWLSFALFSKRKGWLA